MARYIAFLRGINVGGHTVKMQELRRLFESLGFTEVETVIASGNVVFESPERDARALERKIETLLESELGYAVATFVRTPAELTAVVRREPFGELEGEAVVYALFLRDKPSAALRKALEALETENDAVGIGAREVYWLRRTRCKEAEVFGVKFAKALGPESTSRNMTTVRKIAEKTGDG
jgi:uncharacterized protein (DUF1697 family)